LPRKTAPREPVFFVDRSLGGKLVAEALRAAGATVIAHDDAFEQNAKDVEWLAEAGRRGWIVLTKDAAIRRNPREKAMFHAAQVRVFTLARKNLIGAEMATLFVKALPGMSKRAAKTPAPFVFSISRGCEFRRLD
jgi:predicted nuclease of predicted toxin-antitoxin system